MSGASELAFVHEGVEVLVCVGPGGVGKTTLAAALAIDAADRGRRVALVTIDPARRLADALGLSGRLDDALREVSGVRGLEAAMLDTRASFDALVARIARSDLDRARILENRVYEAFSRTLARPHAYVAMERLHDLVRRGEHDLVVLDTPPTRSALEILDAPGRLARFVGSGVADELVHALGPHEGQPVGWLARRGQDALAALLARLLGRELATELASFFAIFLHLREGFATRAQEVHALLASPRCRFVLTTAPDGSHLEDARALAEGLVARGRAPEVVLSNRVRRLSAAAGAPEDAPTDDPVLRQVRRHRAALEALDHLRERRAERFVESLPIRPRHVLFPARPEAPLDVSGLRSLWASGREFALRKVSS
ncbi:MAG: AAA family ATPase [Sandaracinaceae bacterium]|nr:AAA family ATPase [Sandaracinaceae bacterium]